MWTLIISALSLGFLGSFHCIGMCGPIALALPVQHLKGHKKLIGILLYNLGRVTTYTLFGLVFGCLGRQFYLGGLQQWLSVLLGFSLLLTAALQYIPGRRAFIKVRFGRLSSGIMRITQRLLLQRQLGALYAIGFFNGCLPCGLVYLGIAGAVATVHVYQGALFMAAFGAGTLPAMLALSASRQLISLRARNSIKRWMPVVITLMGLLLIIRGLNLGIPYLSPAMSAHTRVMEYCHK